MTAVPYDDYPNADAKTAMGEDIVRPYYLASLDIVGDPIFVTNAPYSIAFDNDATIDDGLNGKTFLAVRPDLVSVSPVRRKEGGTETVTCTMSGLLLNDNELMNAIGDQANFQGREMRLWQMRYDEELRLIGNIWPFHTGYMTVPKIVGDKTSQTIALDSESYMSFIQTASNRSYLDQSLFDSDDQSAAASIACANGQTGAGRINASIYNDQPSDYQNY